MAKEIEDDSLNRHEINQQCSEEIEDTKLSTQNLFSDFQFNYSNNDDKGVLMKQRYEDARKKLVRYQNQIAQCHNIKKSLDDEF
jgi:hypothetical protein